MEDDEDQAAHYVELRRTDDMREAVTFLPNAHTCMGMPIIPPLPDVVDRQFPLPEVLENGYFFKVDMTQSDIIIALNRQLVVGEMGCFAFLG
jgi:hypothetical protein